MNEYLRGSEWRRWDLHVHTPGTNKNDQYEVQFDLCGEQLEHAFDFMEATFGQSQEMVVFITSLNMGFYSVRFLGEYECERYYRYNQTLLFDGQEKEILEKIEKQ